MAEEIVLRYGLNHDHLYKGNDDCRIVCRLDIEPSKAYRAEHKSVHCDLCLVLDASGSMDEPFSGETTVTKRQATMAAAKEVVSHLDAEDTLSLVFYDSRAYRIANLVPGALKDEIRNKIDSLENFSGATDFEAALKTAQGVMADGKNASKRIVFLTDGQASSGDEKSVERIVGELSRDGVVVDCLGVGNDFDFHYMRKLSAASNGRTFLLESPKEADARFEELLESAQKVVASNVFLTILFPPGLRDAEIYQWHPEMRYYGITAPDPSGKIRTEINVQTIRQDRRNIFFLKARMDPPENDFIGLFANAKLDFDLPPAGLCKQQENLNVYVNFSDDAKATEYDTSIDDGFQEVELAKLDEKFQEQRRGDWVRALSILEEMIRRARNLEDQYRLDEYNRYKERLKKEHKLSDDDFNRVGSISARSTRAEEGYMEDTDEEAIWDSL